MDLGLAGRTYIVTGGTAGLGLATAQVLVDEGANVVVASRDQQRAEAAAATLGDHATGISVDIRDIDAPARLIETARVAFDGLDGAFVSYGGPPAGSGMELDDQRLLDSVASALVAPVRLVRDVVAALVEAGTEGGSVVALTSSSQAQPVAGLAGSNVTRPGIWGYVKTLADEAGPRGVRVNCLVPGRLATGRVAELEAAFAERAGQTPQQVRDAFEAGIPLRRVGDPSELGRVAAFLLSPAASYVTGTAWAVDGGLIRGL